MGVSIDVLEVIKRRLARAVNRVYMGAKEEAFTSKDLPLAIIQLIIGEDEVVAQGYQMASQLTVEIAYLVNKLPGSDPLVKEGSGPLAELEKVLDTLETDESGMPNVDLSGTTRQHPKLSYSVESKDGFYIFRITMAVESKRYSLGNRKGEST